MKKNFDAGLASYDDIFQSSEAAAKETLSVTRVPPQELNDFPGHTFKVVDDEDMSNLISLIDRFGIVEPLIVRAGKDKGYDIIAGHRRRFAALRLGLPEVPVIIRNDLDEDQARLLMILSNKHRLRLLPSEKARSYKMLFEIENRQGKRSDLTSRHNVAMLEDAKKSLSKSENLGIRQMQRYIRLTSLTDELLDMVDENKITLSAGYELSFLKQKSQEIILEVMRELKKAPSAGQIRLFVQYEKSEILTAEYVESIMLQKRERKKDITFSGKRITQYFPEAYSREEMEEVIVTLLENWKKNNL